MKYPMQIDSVLRPNKTLGVDANLCLPTDDEYAQDRKMPLEMHSNFSRFTLSILENKDSVKANIPANDVEYIQTKSDLAQSEILKYQLSDKQETLSIAYTQKLFDKNFKGKTPAEVLINEPSRKDELLRTRKFLMDNVHKYKTNQVQIDAIDEAIELFENGKLKNIGNQAKNIPIYDEPTKVPNAQKVDENGLTFVYSIKIECMPDRNYPFAVTIMNGKAPTVKDSKTGKQTAEMSKIENKKEFSINLTEKEWVNLIRKMHSTLKNFENMNFSKQYNLAKKNSYFG